MTSRNPNSRLEAFCDGVFAIALTLLIIDIKIPATIEINNTFIVYFITAIISFWFPFTIAIITTLTLVFWLFYGVKMKHE